MNYSPPLPDMCLQILIIHSGSRQRFATPASSRLVGAWVHQRQDKVKTRVLQGLRLAAVGVNGTPSSPQPLQHVQLLLHNVSVSSTSVFWRTPLRHPMIYFLLILLVVL